MRKFIPGEVVYIVERDEDAIATEVCGYMFLAEVKGLACIVTPFICGFESLKKTLQYHICETAENYGTELAMFPFDDCYPTQDGADAALRDEQEIEV